MYLLTPNVEQEHTSIERSVKLNTDLNNFTNITFDNRLLYFEGFLKKEDAVKLKPFCVYTLVIVGIVDQSYQLYFR